MLISSTIIQDIIALREAGSATIVYIYCDFRDEDKQSCRNLLLSILFQLSAQSNPCLDALSYLYSKLDKGALVPSDDGLIKSQEVLSLSANGPVYLCGRH